MNILTKALIVVVAALGLLLLYLGYRNNHLKEELETVQHQKADLEDAIKLYQQMVEENQKVTEQTSKQLSTFNNRIDKLKNEAHKVPAAPVAFDTGRLSVIRAAIKEANTATAGSIPQ